MVFESIVAELLNKVLGEYIQNLDYKQLKLSLWGGDVVLKDLLIKESALDMLDLPIKLEYGRLGKLILKIPFKDMWNGQIDAIVEDLFILIVPTSQSKYDPEKEEKAQLEAKRAEIARVEKSKQLADLKNQEKVDDSMMEKLLARMIKNIHVEINRIHVRYEDHVTFKEHPFSVGLTLNRFALESCDRLWSTHGNLKDMYAIQQIFKLCTMDGFAVYLNPSPKQFSTEPQSKYLQIFSESIATADHIPEDYQYLLGPINVKAKLKLNPKPETDGSNYTIPKVFLDLEMQKLRIGLTKKQYQTLMQMGEGLERAKNAAPYRKYRPDLLSYRGHYKEWWHFAYKCILEEHIIRARKNWDWAHMKDHRDTCRSYAQCYQTKLTTKNLPSDIEEQLTEHEKKLDLFNLVRIRQQIEMEVERLAEKEKNLKAKRGWFGWVWGTPKEEEVQELNTAAAIMRKFEEEMTPAEKEKLYRAIDYQENSAPAHYPETYEEIDTMFFLHGLQILLLDTDKSNSQVLDLQLNGVKAGFKSRPSANAILVTTSIKDLKLLGVKQGHRVPSLFNSNPDASSEHQLFSVSYEKNPLDKLCGDRVIVKSSSVHMVYDAQTIIELIKLFKVQNASTLSQLQAAAAEQLVNLKEVSALGLEYAIQKHAALDIQVDLKASQLIVPHGGLYSGNESLFVINLGSFKMQSMEKFKEDSSLSVKQLITMGKTEEDILNHLREHSYDKFVLKIVNFQALISMPNEDWRDALTNTISPIKVLQPTTLEIQFHKCLVTDDPLLPKTRLIGNLPSVAINITENRLFEGLAIAQSIPIPEVEEPTESLRVSMSKSLSQMSLFKEITNIPSKMEKMQETPSPLSSMKQMIDLEAKFVMKEFTLTVSKQEDESKVSPFIRFELLQLEAELMQLTFNQEVMLRLGGVQVKQHHHTGEIFMINTPMSSGKEEYLIVVKFINMNKHSPKFSRSGSVVNLLQLEFTTLDMLLHQEALINVLHFLSNIQDKISAATTVKERKSERKVDRVGGLTTIQEDTSTFIKEQFQKQRKSRRKQAQVEIIDLKVTAKIGTISLKMANDFREISAFNIEGITANYIMKASHSIANVQLSSVNVKDLNTMSIYRNIVSVEGSESLQIDVIINNVEPDDVDNNMSIAVTMGCHRIVFLNAFVTSVMNFLNNFQAAQQAIAEASAAAAEAAKTNIKDVHERAARIELSVKLKAPVIYVPLNSKSEYCLMLDMGNLTISNELSRLNVNTESGESPIIDKMNVELQNLKLSRLRLNKQNFVADNEVRLLQPVSFILEIKRNLSTSWFREVPDIEMSGRLKSINVLLNQEDYAMIMATLSENLGETVEDKASITHVPRIERKQTLTEESVRPTTFKADVEVIKERESDLQEQRSVQTTIKFEFIMDSLVIELFTGGSKMLQSQNSPLHLPENSLGRFGLTYLAVKGRMFADGLLATSILLMNCTLDDTRKIRQGSLIRIMERTSEVPVIENLIENDAKPIRSMLDVTVRKGLNDMFVDVRVFSFSIIVSLDYLMKIKDFFNAGQPLPSQQLASQSSQKSQFDTNTKKKVAQPPPPVNDTKMTINLHIEKPDIILLEDMDDIDSNCIVLNTEMFLKVRIMGDHQVINGSIKDLSILAGIYNPAKRSDWIYQVLRPTSISIAGSTPEDKGLHIDVQSTDIHLSVSPGVIEILNRVVQTITKKDEEGTEVKKPEPNHEGLWVITPFTEPDYWFLKTEVAVEALEDLQLSDDEEVTNIVYKPELAIVSAPTILLTLEAGVGNKTLPMLLLHLGFQSNIHDWSTSTMSIDSTMSVVMAYYNSRLALWEPLIEPMEAIQNGKRTSRPWELNAKMQFNDISIDPAVNAFSPVADVESDELQQKSKMSIDITSSENLEITVTKTCLEVLKQLGNAFSNAMVAGNKTSTTTLAPYILKNETGLPITLDLEQSNFKVAESENTVQRSSAYAEVILNSGASIELASKIKTEIHLLQQLKADTVKEQGLNKFVIAFKDINSRLEIPVLRADKRFYSLKYRKEGSEEWGIISDVIVEDGSTIVTLRSILQVHNHFSEPVSVYYMTKRGNEVEKLGTVQPDKKFNLPLDAVYTTTNIYWLFFSIEGYMVSVDPFIWKDLQKTVSMTKVLKCESRNKMEVVDPFYIQTLRALFVVAISVVVSGITPIDLPRLNFMSKQHRVQAPPTSYPVQAVGEMEQIYFENTSRHTMASTIYNVHLYPSIYLKNFLPIDIAIILPGNVEEKKVEAGATLQIPTIDPNNSNIVIKLPQYLEKDWSCRIEIKKDPPEFSVWSFESFDSAQKVIMDLGMHISTKHGSIVMALYCPFWMLNKTGLMLSYRKSSKGGKEHSSPVKSGESHLNVLYHPETFKGPILFSFKSKAFFGKKKAMVRIEDGEWSDKFSIDVAGSKGVVSCKYNGKIYQIGVHNQLTYNSLTKQITFTPYYVLINDADFLIECQEANRPADPVIKVPPQECAAFWPNSEQEVKTLQAKVASHPEKTAAFIYTDVHTTLLKLDNKYGGINVDVQINEGGVYISLSGYTHGNAPALIVNHTSYPMNLWEKGSINIRTIQQYNRMFYTWEKPAGSKILVWEDGTKKEIEDNLRKDTLGYFHHPDIPDMKIFYVSFLDGIQRVLLFTKSSKIAEDCQLLGSLEVIDQDVTMKIHGLGLSLVNNINKTELLYMCIASSGIIWEGKKLPTGRWKALSDREVFLIEQGYQKYMMELHVDKETAYRVALEPKFEVDFLNLMMLRPHKRYLRRTFQTGLWFQYRTSAHQVQLHAKINKLQIDNQLPDCIFPVILAPVPPPKSVSQSSVMKPFAEMSIVKRLLAHSNVQQFRYFKVLIQEFHVKVDLAFANALMLLFEDAEANEAQQRELFKTDMKLVDEPLLHHVNLITTAQQKNFFDLLHFSPLKIHISFSMTGTGGGPSAVPQVLNVVLQGIGVTLTDINDIVFKLAYFERDYVFMTNNQVISEATSHYTGQAIKQLYVLVLGLDVIGNPYGLVVGAMKGVEDLFYEPFQGAIQGPGEFAEGLLLGMRSMLGHTVGGMAGAVSKITGAMGKGLAALTFDKDYQRKRQEQLNKQPANLQEGLARSGKSLISGVFDGVTGVVTKPISGAKEEGVEGFFKGFGKGVVGLVTRPTSGIVDFASGSFGAVRRATDLNEETKRVRPPRFLQPDSLVRPYVRDDAEGNKILGELEKGKYANTDMYYFHMNMGKDVLLLTDKRIAYLEKCDLFGGWKVDWSYTWQEIDPPPVMVDKGIQISLKDGQRRKKLGGLFGNSDSVKVLLIPDLLTKQLLCSKIHDQLRQYKA
ncbi:intermembrane lipid transfer protein Vps13 isoform X2 [Phymastichus coffea]|uniref:intermembrane lipid transfer protein Vps13 isoform X2 n=1 Tax=Phymastichus coffea TaxID=108790 RepID=UPI00273B6FBB|nr:intermembrane lipid transfer protein Vps13 isoform X2 [Phymastichus coffea]